MFTLKMAFVILLALMVWSPRVWSQSSVLSAGSDAMGNGGSASYSVGQIVYTSHSGSSGTSHQGVQQPYEFYITTSVEESSGIMLFSKVFPNPAQTDVTLSIEDMNGETLRYEVYDVMGKQILADEIIDKTTTIPLQECVSGTYILKVIKSNSTLKTFTIIKHL